MNNSKLILAIAILLTTLVQGCAPEYKTSHTFIAPKTAEGKSCVFQCENTRMQCDQLDQMRVDNCRMRAENNYAYCEQQKQAAYNNCVASGAQGCYQEWCQKEECPTSDRCENQYQRCYSTCGGQVTSETHCVANCEK